MGVGIEGLRMWLKLFDWDACAFQISVRHCQSCQHMLGLSNGSATYHEVSCLCLHQPLTIHINSRSQQNHGHTSQSPPYQAVFPVTKKVKSQCSHFNLPSLTVFQHEHHPTHGPTIPPRPHLSAAGEPPFLRNGRINRNWH